MITKRPFLDQQNTKPIPVVVVLGGFFLTTKTQNPLKPQFCSVSAPPQKNNFLSNSKQANWDQKQFWHTITAKTFFSKIAW